jgi:cell division septum initiation protein DivIVA
MAIWNGFRNNREEEEGEPELPKAIQDQLDEAKGLKVKVEELSSKLSGLDDITAYIREQRENAAKPKPQTRRPEDEEAENAELAQLLLTNPKDAWARLSVGANTATALLLAQNAKREVFQDNAEKFPYYTGEVKAEIDKILSKQSLEFQRNPEALENTYYTVLGKMHKEIQEGKIKDRFASSSSTSRTSGLKEDEDSTRKITKVTPDIEHAARLTGLKVEDYMDLLNKDAEAYI